VLAFGTAQESHEIPEERLQALLGGAARFRIHAARLRHADAPVKAYLTE
jgi:hypothetical protein